MHHRTKLTVSTGQKSRSAGFTHYLQSAGDSHIAKCKMKVGTSQAAEGDDQEEQGGEDDNVHPDGADH